MAQTKINMQHQMLAYYKENLRIDGEGAKRLYNICVNSIQTALTKADIALKQNNYEELYSVIHTLKGVLASTGLDELLQIVNELNIKAKEAANGNKDAIDDDFKEKFLGLKQTLSLLQKE